LVPTDSTDRVKNPSKVETVPRVKHLSEIPSILGNVFDLRTGIVVERKLRPAFLV
jgi:hypothetical protein